MAQSFDAHSQSRTTWSKAKAEVVGDIKLGTPEYYAANRHAYSVATPQMDRVKQLLTELFWGELAEVDKAFLTGNPEAVSKVIDFLEVDIPAFRCGYAKEWYLRRLKSLPLSDKHRLRLKSLALSICGSATFRREF